MEITKSMSDRSERPRRDSLVEKAARKLADIPDDVGAARSGEVGLRAKERASASATAAVRAPVAEPTAAGDTASAIGIPVPSTADDSVTEPAAMESISRRVQVDYSSLASNLIITPGGKRDKTTEEFRLLKRTVLAKRWQLDTPNANLILVTSALPGDGKTFVAINLAMSMATEQDVRVLLVDCDLSKPTIPGIFGVKAERGLIDVLTDDNVRVSDVLIRTDIERLTLLPAGGPHNLTTELLASQRMAKFVDELAKRYPDRIVVFDSPPVLATSEPSALAAHVGQILFVVRSNKTSRSAIRAGLDILKGCSNIGFVFNGSQQQLGAAQFGHYKYKGYYYYK